MIRYLSLAEQVTRVEGAVMLAVAAGEVDEAWLADWLRQRTTRTA